MNTRGGLLISAILLIVVFVLGVTMGVRFDNKYLSPAKDTFNTEKAELESQLTDLQEKLFNEGKNIETSNLVGIESLSDNSDVLFCESDTDCVIKLRSYCCQDVVKNQNKCVSVNDKNVGDLNCEGVTSCLVSAGINDCVCINNKCAPVFSSSLVGET